MRDIHWAADDLIIAATGDRAIRIMQVGTRYKMVQKGMKNHLLLHTDLRPGCFTDLHDDSVREIALNKLCVGQFVSGGMSFSFPVCTMKMVGFDKRLCLMDINCPERLIQSVKFDGVIGSVKWPLWNQSTYMSILNTDELFRRLRELHLGHGCLPFI